MKNTRFVSLTRDILKNEVMKMCVAGDFEHGIFTPVLIKGCRKA